MTTNKIETHKFDAEIGKVLNLVINSLYTNKDIFIRELLSNASDACDKLRYAQNTNPNLSKDAESSELKISIKINEKDKILEISDSGIGMSKEELLNNLGTIAKSGTQNFIENLSDNEKKNNELIGQFGVGFYSSYMVADKVTVISTKAESEQSYIWVSEGKGEFTIEESTEKVNGTRISLHMKQGMENFLDKFNIKNIVKTYSDHIAFPIELVGVEKDSATEIINSSQAIWTKSKSDIKQDEYDSFYKSISHSASDPWLTIHNKAEGVIEYTNLLYIPNERPFDLFHPDRKCQVKLYVKKVFITEDNVELIPGNLRFLRGVVDSQDLPLNISRETLQNNSVIDKIRSSIVKKLYSELAKKLKKSRESYEKFWENFGSVLKEGLCEYSADKDKIFDLCLFKTSKSGDKYISLDDYIANMQKDQKAIYCLIGHDAESLMQSPQIEAFLAKDIEVIFLTDGVDDFWLSTNPAYKEKDLKSVTRSGNDIENIAEDKKAEKEQEKDESELKDLLELVKEVLKEQVSEVRISKKLTTSPACLAASESGMDIRMERMLIEQGQLKESTKKIFELNPKHNIIQNMNKIIKTKRDDVVEYAKILFDQACIIEGEAVKEPLQLAKRIGKLLEANIAA
ncbi:MAG: molecular chaperone HtpG [Alphaproteobacteria bacterium]|jgi:molecular chaperone HtpG|nr:molecular chaperone HtpG [Alphaproteobacteria bacterium]